MESDSFFGPVGWNGQERRVAGNYPGRVAVIFATKASTNKPASCTQQAAPSSSATERIPIVDCPLPLQYR